MHSYCKLHDTLEQQCRINVRRTRFLHCRLCYLVWLSPFFLFFLVLHSSICALISFYLGLHPCHVLTKEDGNFHTNYDSSNYPCTFTIHFSLQSSQGFLLLTPLFCSLWSHDLKEGAAEIPPDACNFNHLHRSRTT